MFDADVRPVSVALLLGLAAASCGRTSHDDERPLAPSGGTSANTTGASANTAGVTAAAGGAGGAATSIGGMTQEVIQAGAPTTLDPSTPSRACSEGDVPGAQCEDPHCFGRRCGVRVDLVCRNGSWKNLNSSLAWDLTCPRGNEGVTDVGEIVTGACCGEELPKNDVFTEPPSCNLCPDAAPNDGDSCSLPNDCAPAIIDCFYECCCYGETIWAQCDGKRWRVATNCSDK
ncbi:MAG TPA: hypothetical protein VFQ61_00595 [Polyangiaceae bacterium]|nr:hypothetical protein [Polyangiaceae bacterium]